MWIHIQICMQSFNEANSNIMRLQYTIPARTTSVVVGKELKMEVST